MMEIIPYNDQYKAQTIKFVLAILEDELGYTDIERPDLYDIVNVYQQDTRSNFWLAILNDRVVGTIALKSYANGCGLLKRMYIQKDMRNQGIGQQLMNVLLHFAKSFLYQTIYASTVTEFISARGFYKKNGFIEISELPKNLLAAGDNIFFELKV